MGLLYTLSAFTLAGVGSRVIALGLMGFPFSKDLAKSALWVSGWAAAGYSFHSWKQRQEEAYLKQLKHLVDRKQLRDEWDRLYLEAFAKEE